jgi:hypothetical protein
MKRFEWLAPLSGIVFVALLIIGFAITGETPDPTEDSAEEVIQYAIDNDDELMLGGALVSLSGVFMVFFGSWLRKALAGAPGSGGAAANVAFAGAIIIAGAAATGGTLSFGLGDLADDISPEAVEALNAVSWDYFFPLAVGVTTLLIGAGLSTVLYGPLPKWLGWVAIVIGIVSHTPIGFFGWALAGVWVIVVSVLLSLRARTPRPPPPAQPVQP